jgi:hypothetical protein
VDHKLEGLERFVRAVHEVVKGLSRLLRRESLLDRERKADGVVGTDYLLLAKDHGRWIILQVLWQSPPPK